MVIFIPSFLSPQRALSTPILEAASCQPSATPDAVFLSLSGQSPQQSGLSSSPPQASHSGVTAAAGLGVENKFRFQGDVTHNLFFELGVHCPGVNSLGPRGSLNSPSKQELKQVQDFQSPS